MTNETKSEERRRKLMMGKTKAEAELELIAASFGARKKEVVKEERITIWILYLMGFLWGMAVAFSIAMQDWAFAVIYLIFSIVFLIMHKKLHAEYIKSVMDLAHSIGKIDTLVTFGKLAKTKGKEEKDGQPKASI